MLHQPGPGEHKHIPVVKHKHVKESLPGHRSIILPVLTKPLQHDSHFFWLIDIYLVKTFCLNMFLLPQSIWFGRCRSLSRSPTFKNSFFFNSPFLYLILVILKFIYKEIKRKSLHSSINVPHSCFHFLSSPAYTFSFIPRSKRSTNVITKSPVSVLP